MLEGSLEVEGSFYLEAFVASSLGWPLGNGVRCEGLTLPQR
jgi:hypothetical protein